MNIVRAELLNEDWPKTQVAFDHWILARPLGYKYMSRWERIKTAYRVYTGEFDALKWGGGQ